MACRPFECSQGPLVKNPSSCLMKSRSGRIFIENISKNVDFTILNLSSLGRLIYFENYCHILLTHKASNLWRLNQEWLVTWLLPHKKGFLLQTKISVNALCWPFKADRVCPELKEIKRRNPVWQQIKSYHASNAQVVRPWCATIMDSTSAGQKSMAVR